MIQILKRTVSLGVQDLLPSVLIDYLWSLAEEKKAGNAQCFLLTKQVLGGRQLQEVRHISDGHTIAVHKVFGFEPVSICILLIPRENSLHMEAGSLLEAMAQV